MPRYSVVIPTRNGAETLRSALQTVLRVDYDDFEVIVCDNDTGDATRSLIEAVSSPRLKYVRAPRNLAMSANWELAVSQAKGQYVTVLGDDDGLLPYAFRELDRLLELTSARAVRWEAGFFVWPTVDIPGQANYLKLPSRRGVRIVDSRRAIASILEFDRCYSTLPMIYNSVVERRLLDEIRSRSGGLFLNRYPDIYSGFCIAHAAGTYASTDLPMSVAGVSKKSTGLGTLFRRSRNGDDWIDLNTKAELRAHPRLPDLLVFPSIPVADSFLHAQQALFPDDSDLALDRGAVFVHCVKTLRAQSQEEWDRAIAELRASAGDESPVLEALDAELAETEPRIGGSSPLRQGPPGADENYIHLNTDQFGVETITDAVRLADQVLACSASPPEYRIESSSPEQPPLRQLQQQLTEIHDQLLAKDADLQVALGDVLATQRLLEDKDAALQQALAELASLQNSLSSKHESLLQSLEASRRSEAQLQAKHAALQAAQGSLQAAQSALLAKEQALQEVTRGRAQLQQDLTSKEQALQASLSQLRQLQADLEAKEQSLQSLHRSAGELQTALQEKHQALHSALEHATGLNTRIIEREQELIQVRAELEECLRWWWPISAVLKPKSVESREAESRSRVA